MIAVACVLAWLIAVPALSIAIGLEDGLSSGLIALVGFTGVVVTTGYVCGGIVWLVSGDNVVTRWIDGGK
jgi:hypothetical protein